MLSAIKPTEFSRVLNDIHSVLKPGGRILFRDYAVNDMAMIRFGPGTKLGDRHYLRQDGTQSYFFERDSLRKLAEEAGFSVKELEQVERSTTNKKEGIDAKRIFLQGVFEKTRL